VKQKGHQNHSNKTELHQVSSTVEHLCENIEDLYRKNFCQRLWHRKKGCCKRQKKEGLPVSLVQGREKKFKKIKMENGNKNR
jgi:hypothetical protein